MIITEKIPPTLKKREKTILKPVLSLNLFPFPGISISFTPLGQINSKKNKNFFKKITSEKNLPYLFLLLLGLVIMLGGKK